MTSNRNDRASRVIKSALELGLRHPRDEVPIEAIAKNAGMTFWQAHHCFGNLENLYRAAATKLVAEIEADLADAPQSARTVSEGIRSFVTFAADAVQKDAYLRFLRIVIRDRHLEPLLDEMYEKRVLMSFKRGLETIVRSAGDRLGLVILLPQGAARDLLKSLEAELVLPQLLPSFVKPRPEEAITIVQRLATATMALTYPMGSRAA